MKSDSAIPNWISPWISGALLLGLTQGWLQHKKTEPHFTRTHNILLIMSFVWGRIQLILTISFRVPSQSYNNPDEFGWMDAMKQEHPHHHPHPHPHPHPPIWTCAAGHGLIPGYNHHKTLPHLDLGIMPWPHDREMLYGLFNLNKALVMWSFDCRTPTSCLQKQWP